MTAAELLEKGERGPRGGNIIGRDKKGKPIYGKEGAGKVQAKRKPAKKKPKGDPSGPQKIEAGDREARPTPGEFRKMPVGTVVKIPGGATFTKERATGEGWVETFGGKDDKRYTGSWDILSDLFDHGGTIAQKSDLGGTDMEKGNLTQAKAKKILKDGEVHGQALTDQQKKFFGAIAGGEEPREKSQDPESPEEEERMEAEKEKKKDPKPPPLPATKKSGIDDLGEFARLEGERRKVFTDERDLEALELEKADDGKPGESLGETSTEELTRTHKDIMARLKGEPKDAAALSSRRDAIAAELKKRAGKTDLKTEKCAEKGYPMQRSEDAAEAVALQEGLEKGMGCGPGSSRGILEWADQFYHTPWHVQALQCIKDKMECARANTKLWKNEVPYDERRKWSGAKRGTYEAKHGEAYKKIRKEEDAITERMDGLESNLINYRLDEEKARKSGVDDLADFAKGGGPYLGPRQGKWADPQHTIPWDDKIHGAGAKKPEAEKPAGKVPKELRGTITVNGKRHEVEAVWEAKPDGMGGHKREYRIRTARGKTKGMTERIDAEGKSSFGVQYKKHKYMTSEVRQASGKTKKDPGVQFEKVQTAMAKIASKGTGNWTDADYKKMVDLGEKRVKLQKEMGEEPPAGLLANIAKWKEQDPGMRAGKPAEKPGSIRDAHSKLTAAADQADVELGAAKHTGDKAKIAAAQKKANTASAAWSASAKKKREMGNKLETANRRMTKLSMKGTDFWTEKDRASMLKVADQYIALTAKLGMAKPEGLIANRKRWAEMPLKAMKEHPMAGRGKKPAKVKEPGGKQLTTQEKDAARFARASFRGMGEGDTTSVGSGDKKVKFQKRGGKLIAMESGAEVDLQAKDPGVWAEKKPKKEGPSPLGTATEREPSIRPEGGKPKPPPKATPEPPKQSKLRFKSMDEWIENQEEDDMSEENLAKAGEEVEVEEEPTEQTGIDELGAFAKAQSMPEGNPKQKLGVGEEQGGKLAGVGETSGSNTSGGGPGQDKDGQAKVKKPGKDKLSDDDADDEGQMKPHKKPIETKKSVSPQGQRDMVAQEQAAAVSKLQKGEEDVEAGGATPTPPEPKEDLEKGRTGSQGVVQYTEASDIAVEKLQKSGEFYTGGSPSVVPFSRPIGVGKSCPRCKANLSKSLTACPECGLGTTVHRVVPGGEAQGDHDGEPIVKSRSGKLRPRIEKDVPFK